jgi:hypothetical protein
MSARWWCDEARSTSEQTGDPSLREASAESPSVRKVNDEISLPLTGDFPGRQFGLFPGGVMAQLDKSST